MYSYLRDTTLDRDSAKIVNLTRHLSRLVDFEGVLPVTSEVG
jgi:hypothetical protein